MVVIESMFFPHRCGSHKCSKVQPSCRFLFHSTSHWVKGSVAVPSSPLYRHAYALLEVLKLRAF